MQTLQNQLGYLFQNPALLALALTHESVNSNPSDNNQRLEFLGDAILNTEVALFLFQQLPDATEGALTMIRSAIVREAALAMIARDWQLDHWLAFQGDLRRRTIDAALADAVEAVLGAIWIDGGHAACRRIIRQFTAHLLNAHRVKPGKDPKTHLQEIMHAQGNPVPHYHIVSWGHGTPGKVEAECSITHQGTCIATRAQGHTKKTAEMAAATHMIARLQVKAVCARARQVAPPRSSST